MAHEIESMTYVGETPWHGLGVKLNAPPTIKEAITAGGLDWSVDLQQLQLPDGTPVSRYGVVRSSDKAVLGTVGAGFHAVQNADAFQFFQPYLDAKVATIETAGSLRGGSRVWMLAKIDRPDSVIVKKADDRVAKYLVLANGHDGSLALTAGLTPTRVVCQNTLSAAIDTRGAATIKIRHTSGAADALKVVQETIDRVDRDFEKAAEVFRALSKVQVTEKMLRTFVDRVFLRNGQAMKEAAKAARASIEIVDQTEAEEEKTSRVFEKVAKLFDGGRGNDLKGVKGTAWAAYNAATEYLTWERGADNDIRMNTLWFGGNRIGQRTLAAATATFLQAA